MTVTKQIGTISDVGGDKSTSPYHVIEYESGDCYVVFYAFVSMI